MQIVKANLEIDPEFLSIHGNVFLGDGHIDLDIHFIPKTFYQKICIIYIFPNAQSFHKKFEYLIFRRLSDACY